MSRWPSKTKTKRLIGKGASKTILDNGKGDVQMRFEAREEVDTRHYTES